MFQEYQLGHLEEACASSFRVVSISEGGPHVARHSSVLKHDRGLLGGMLADDVALKFQVARSSFVLRLIDCQDNSSSNNAFLQG